MKLWGFSWMGKYGLVLWQTFIFTSMIINTIWAFAHPPTTLVAIIILSLSVWLTGLFVAHSAYLCGRTAGSQQVLGWMRDAQENAQAELIKLARVIDIPKDPPRPN